MLNAALFWCRLFAGGTVGWQAGGLRLLRRGSPPLVGASWTEAFDVAADPAGRPGRRGGYADVEVLLPGGQDNRVQVRLAAAMGWPLERKGTVVPSARGVSRCRAGFPVDVPGGDQQMTLVVSLPLLARWNGARRRAVTGEFFGRLAAAGIEYKVIQVADPAGGVICLPKPPAAP
jgi:hypothetical protein